MRGLRKSRSVAAWRAARQPHRYTPRHGAQRPGVDPLTPTLQTTLARPVEGSGVGLHSGSPVRLRLDPAEAGHGVVFVRSDLGGLRVRAHVDSVRQTRLGTTLADSNGASVATVEHLMAALWGCGVDNVDVWLDGPEVPAMDGSAAPFASMIQGAGLRQLDEPRRAIRILRPVVVDEGDRRIAIRPAERLSVGFEIRFEHPAIGRQVCGFGGASEEFVEKVAPARTFGLESDVRALREAGFALGGSLDNAVVVGSDAVLNEGGLRMPDELVRHKVLDCLGDLYLAGGRVLGHVDALRSGHRLTIALLRAVFADDANWCWQER